MMKTQTENLLLFVEPNSEAETPDDSPFKFFLVNEKHRFWCNSNNQIRVGEVEVSYPIPDKIGEDALALAAIKTLKERQQKIRDDATRDCEKLEEEIRKLSLLTYQPTEVILDEPERQTDDLPF